MKILKLQNTLLLIILLVTACNAGQPIRIVSYNVENLFHPTVDSVNRDTSFTPEGPMQWTFTRYQDKLHNLAKVIASIGEWEQAPLVGLVEVESRQCLQDLCSGHLSNFNYEILHYDSPDLRGIDCALLYQPEKLKLIESHPIVIHTDSDYRPTRDVLYAKLLPKRTKDTLHIMVCHLPSQLGGEIAARNRQKAFNQLQGFIDSILSVQPDANILMMGDMNYDPQDNLKSMTNLMVPMQGNNNGTYNWKGNWNFLDQFYVSDNMKQKVEPFVYKPDWLLEEDIETLTQRPVRCYFGKRYQNGYSDHLPVYLDWKL